MQHVACVAAAAAVQLPCSGTVSGRISIPIGTAINCPNQEAHTGHVCGNQLLQESSHFMSCPKTGLLRLKDIPNEPQESRQQLEETAAVWQATLLPFSLPAPLPQLFSSSLRPCLYLVVVFSLLLLARNFCIIFQ